MWDYILLFQWLNDIPASPSKIILWNPSFTAHLMAYQAALISPSREFPLSNCSDHDNKRLPAVSLPTTATVVFSSRIAASKFSLIFGEGDQTTSLDGLSFCSFQAFFMLHEDSKNHRWVQLYFEQSTSVSHQWGHLTTQQTDKTNASSTKHLLRRRRRSETASGGDQAEAGAPGPGGEGGACGQSTHCLRLGSPWSFSGISFIFVPESTWYISHFLSWICLFFLEFTLNKEISLRWFLIVSKLLGFGRVVEKLWS